MSKQKEIVALSEVNHIRLRPGMYISTVDVTDEKLILIKDNLLKTETKQMSIGFYKLLNEILDNGFDALKRDKITNGKITLKVYSENSKVIVSDSAYGFYEPSKINSTSGLSNVETAVSMLRAGSNFYNDDIEDNLIGTNGVGSAVVNMLSDYFKIVTINKEEIYSHVWEDFKTTEVLSEKNTKNNPTGTTVEFIPLKSIFKDNKYSIDILQSQMAFKKYLLRSDSLLKNVDFRFYFDDILINLDTPFLPEKIFKTSSPIGELIIYPSFSDSTNISFINGVQCGGIHQKIIQDWLNDNIFKIPNGHHFYETFINLNLPPKHVRFGDQNKTKYAVGRGEIEPILLKAFEKSLKGAFKGSEICDLIIEKIEESTRTVELAKISKQKKESKKKISDKYFPPSKKKTILLLTEGQSACGSLNQKRDSTCQGSYALRGKIKNARRLSDLSSNTEIIDLMNILELDLNKNFGCAYEKIIIATDSDPDGAGHIASLLINFFYKWFPHIITENRLFMLSTPLMSGEIDGKIKYVYSLDEQHILEGAKKIRYLKGLGSLNIKDWEKIMKEMKVFQIKEDSRSEKIMKIAFGESADSRKKWLCS